MRGFRAIADHQAHVRLGTPMSVPAKELSRESDSDLLRAIAAGDRRALKVLYLGYQQRLARSLASSPPSPGRARPRSPPSPRLLRNKETPA
jgi:hypothetical protein